MHNLNLLGTPVVHVALPNNDIINFISFLPNEMKLGLPNLL
jgi:hypothetical protein